MTTIYVDNAATTQLSDTALEAMKPMMQEIYGNPSSLHHIGQIAKEHLEDARARAAKCINANPNEIYFTSGGSEADNQAIITAAYNGAKKGKKHIISSKFEHHAVLHTLDKLAKEGFEIQLLDVYSDGIVKVEDVKNALRDETAHVTIKTANNEVGTIMPVDKIKKICTAKNAHAVVHIDCVQAFGKIPVKPQKLGADIVTVTAHKIHGPKGVGAIYIKKGTHIVSRTFGGEQEKKIRPGTEASPLIAGFGAAVDALPDMNEQNGKIKALNGYARQKLGKIDGLVINNDESSSPYILNIYVPTFMRSQTILQELSANYGIYVSNGSACAKGKKSHVLTAMKLPDEIIDKSLRVSFSRYNTENDVDALVTALKELILKHPI